MVTPAEPPKRSGFNVQVLAYKCLRAGVEQETDRMTDEEYRAITEVLDTMAPPTSTDPSAVEKQSREKRKAFVDKLRKPGATLEVEFVMEFCAAPINICNASGQLSVLAGVALEARDRPPPSRLILPGQ